MSRKKTEINPLRAERLKNLIDDLKMSQTDFARAVNYSQQHISGIINKKTALTEETASDILSVFPKYRQQWLLGYDDHMTNKEQFFHVIHNAETEAQLLDNGFMSFALLSGFDVDISPVKECDNVYEAIDNIKNYCTIERDGKSITLDLQEFRDFENELCDYIEFRLQRMMK